MTWRDNPEFHDAERKHRDTKDIRYAALALGRWRASPAYPADPPEWALQACMALWDRSTALMAPIINKTPGGSPYDDDESRIRWVAEQRGTAGETRTPRELLHALLKSEGITDVAKRKAHVVRLMNYYGSEDVTDDGPMNHHIGRAAALRVRDRLNAKRR